MRILAIDASTSNVGWCVAEDDRYLASGQYKPQGRGFEAIKDYAQWLFEHSADVDAVCYERPSGVHGNGWTNTLLGSLWYVTWDVVQFQCELVIVSPAEIKATGYSKNITHDTAKLKASWLRLTGDELDLFKTDAALKRFGDELDAIGCWLAGWRRLQDEQK